MPGIIAPPAPTLVMPQTLCTAYVESRAYAQLRNEYHDGTPEASQLAQSSRRTWKQSKRLSASQLGTLETFWVNVNGGLSPFLFYDLYAGSPLGSNYDASGVNAIGRYVAAFRNNWTQTTSFQRTDVSGLEMIELAPMSADYAEAAGFGPNGAVTGAALYLTTSHADTDVEPLYQYAVLNVGTTLSPGLNVWAGWGNGVDGWSKRTDVVGGGFTYMPGLEISIGLETISAFLANGINQLLVYECYLQLTFANATTKTIVPTVAVSGANSVANYITNPGHAVDGDPSTYALIYSDETGGGGAIGEPPHLIFTFS